MHIPFDNTYAALPSGFYSAQPPTAVKAPSLLAFNEALAAHLGINAPDADEIATVFAGNTVPDGATPLAQLYAGHQFGNFNPQLGDGRALLLGEVIDQSGTRRDIQLKGSGPTPYSRMGTDAPGWGRCCVNMSCPKRCTPLASPPPARWPLSPRASRSGANRVPCRVRC